MSRNQPYRATGRSRAAVGVEAVVLGIVHTALLI